MSATNATANYNLPLFIGTDKPSWLTDWNSAMNSIDSAIANVASSAGGTATDLSALTLTVSGLSSTVSDHTTSISTLTTAVSGNTGSINTINSLIGNGEPTTTDKTIIGAINELHEEIGGGSSVTAAAVSYNGTTSGLTADDVQEAIDELAAAIPAVTTPTAADVTYSNSTSGLTASNVQAAIDELAQSSSGGGVPDYDTSKVTTTTADQTSFTAPANGWFYGVGKGGGTNTTWNTLVNGVPVWRHYNVSTDMFFIPLSAGDVVTLSASGATIASGSTFIPMK